MGKVNEKFKALSKGNGSGHLIKKKESVGLKLGNLREIQGPIRNSSK